MPAELAQGGEGIKNVPAGDTSCDLMVIGAGLAGLAAASFAAERGLSVVLVGGGGGLDFSSGLFDLLGVYPPAEGARRQDPWQAMAELARYRPQHPYARLRPAYIRQALEQMASRLGTAGLPYVGLWERNLEVPTFAGTLKTTYLVPHTIWPGVLACRQKQPCLLVDFPRLKDYSARQMVEVLGDKWPGLRSARVEFPAERGELYPENAAWALHRPETRQRLAQEIKPLLGDARAVGFPALLGVDQTMLVQGHLAEMLGVPVFEVPMPPPSLAGLRLREAFQRIFAAKPVSFHWQKRVLAVETLPSGGFRFQVGVNSPQWKVSARGALLAGGRFLGQGLVADRHHITEPLFGLPVTQPDGRGLWHRPDFWHPAGHGINRAGLEIDDSFRPLAAPGRPAFARLFAAGTILAHQDWMREKCGAGLAIATARAAVDAFCDSPR